MVDFLEKCFKKYFFLIIYTFNHFFSRHFLVDVIDPMAIDDVYHRQYSPHKRMSLGRFT